jgi:hypothetical protein
MKPETIKAIFTNILFVVGVILLIVGFFQGTRTAVKLVTFDKYPLDSWAETRCDYPNIVYDTSIPEKDVPSQADREKQKQDCLDSLEYERSVRMTEDIVGSITLLVSGGALVFFFRKFILR